MLQVINMIRKYVVRHKKSEQLRVIFECRGFGKTFKKSEIRRKETVPEAEPAKMFLVCLFSFYLYV